jgi:predicted nucleic acid-binding protein
VEDKIVVDTSVVIKWFADEEDSEKARLLLNRWWSRDLEIVVPELLIYEATNALCFGKRAPKTLISKAIRDFLLAAPQIYVVNSQTIDLCLSYVFEHSLTVYDAIYVALADMLEIPLVTADEKHHRRQISKNIVYLKDIEKIL